LIYKKIEQKFNFAVSVYSWNHCKFFILCKAEDFFELFSCFEDSIIELFEDLEEEFVKISLEMQELKICEPYPRAEDNPSNMAGKIQLQSLHKN
jgi:hypothetical protein